MAITEPLTKAPAHVPQHLIHDLDIYKIPGLENGTTRDVHQLWKDIQDSTPRVFWTPRQGGHWVTMRYKEIERLVTEYETFSNAQSFIPVGVLPPQIPVMLDPPDHTAYRRLLMPAFTPKALTAATDRARAAAIEIIEQLKPQGHCDFVRDFAGVMPIIAFLSLIKLPTEDYSYLRGLAVQMSNPMHPNCQGAWAELSVYVRDQISRRRKEPREDLITALINGQANGRALTEDEIFSMCLLVIGGGLDTVVSMTSFAACFLAQNPGHRQQLIAQPELLDNAVEEIARRFGTSNLARLVRKETEIGGARLMPGDMILGTFPTAGLDEEVNPDPMTVDFTRKNPRHLAFGSGPHLCIGMRLAKREIRIFLEEWLARIPDFSLAPGTTPHVVTGIVNSVEELQLVWDPA